MPPPPATTERRSAMLKIGNVYYSKQNGCEWLIWHEIQKIENNIVTMINYGHGTEYFISEFSIKELKSMIKKGFLKEA